MLSNRLLESYKEKEKEREERYHPIGNYHNGGNKAYFWLWGYTDSGRKFINGAFNTLQEAEENEFSMSGARNTHIVELKTKVREEAARLIRNMALQGNNNIDMAMKRFKHNIGDA